MKKISNILGLKPILVALQLMVATHQTAQSNETPYTVDHVDMKANQKNEQNWMAHTRFGMFITFGLYSLPAGVWQGEGMGRNHYAEWIRAQWRWPQPSGGIPKKEYDALLAQFNPTKFDADEWINLAAQAGMRYVVITTKHHDGFALWDSARGAWSTRGAWSIHSKYLDINSEGRGLSTVST
jgi:alpha-L-fucosidase